MPATADSGHRLRSFLTCRMIGQDGACQMDRTFDFKPNPNNRRYPRRNHTRRITTVSLTAVIDCSA